MYGRRVIAAEGNSSGTVPLTASGAATGVGVDSTTAAAGGATTLLGTATGWVAIVGKPRASDVNRL